MCNPVGKVLAEKPHIGRSAHQGKTVAENDHKIIRDDHSHNMIMMTMMARKYHIGRISHQDKTVADKNHCEYFDFANDILDMILKTR